MDPQREVTLRLPLSARPAVDALLDERDDWSDVIGCVDDDALYLELHCSADALDALVALGAVEVDEMPE